MSRCYCACHEYPGTYRAEPCAYCGHFDSRGHFPQTLRDGWVEDMSVEGQNEVMRAALRQVYWSADAEDPVSVRVARIASEALDKVGDKGYERG